MDRSIDRSIDWLAEFVYVELCHLEIDGHIEINGVDVGKKMKMSLTEHRQAKLRLETTIEIDFVIENG